MMNSEFSRSSDMNHEGADADHLSSPIINLCLDYNQYPLATLIVLFYRRSGNTNPTE
jgi:hypothetical protein